ncbi:hypothetical protein PPYR_01613 [Photinus pyralis]|uniref:VPS35 endosomal protein-sorting factor-like n=1 Tax=Photinus pyralis TaxID=7054 RepID=A0A1Y1KQE5_PHOPY|nr:VPS35 endosomal protein sorting factor-like [Photinus pyralis]KAB0804643.1 hypothetical protein PPYR_01613 [Photinus pyralis]
MGTNFEWKTLICNKPLPEQATRVSVHDHPLKAMVSNVEHVPRKILGSQPSTGSSTPSTTPAAYLQPLSDALEGLDPLTQFAIQEVDPLTQMAQMQPDYKEEVVVTSKKSKPRQMTIDMEPWSSRKNMILSKFTTSERLTIVSSFLSEGEKVVLKTQSTAVDKVQHRLEQLDYFDEGSQRKLDLSQAEYVARIEMLNRELVSAWHSEQRVKALKIAIQCAKVLADSDVLRFYPSKFVLITDILDIFGHLVYERLRTKADYYTLGSKTPTALPEDFTPSMVPESAKETCRNWFYKIASIRELVPRLYVEMAILKSYSFLTSSEYSAALLRLTHMIRGIGNPLVAVYARCYLCRVGITITATEKDYLNENFYDFLDSYSQVFGRYAMEGLKIQKVTLESYLTLYTPALDFILQAVASGATESLLGELLDRCRNHKNNALLLNTIMSAFKPMHIASRALQFLDLISENTSEDFPTYILLRTLGLCVCVCPPPREHRRQVINRVWQSISDLNNSEHYISCVEVWIEFVVQHFTFREVNIIIGDIVAHLSPSRNYEQYYSQLKSIVVKIVSRMQEFEALLAMDNFLPLIDLFQQESCKVEVCKVILNACNSLQHTSDAVITNTLLFLCTTLHDSVNALTVEDERRQISELLCNVVKTVDYGRDFEQQLNFYAEARAAFSNLDTVLAQLVQCVNTLAVNTRRIVKGHHTRKTAAFVRACAAYCFITVPSITSVYTRLELYLLSGQVALFNNCLGQADACFKAALKLLPELMLDDNQKQAETFLVSYVRNFLSVLLIVPDSPDSGVLSCTRILLNTLPTIKWNSENTVLPNLYLNVLDMLSAMAQESYPYHIDKVESNDSLYGSDPKFLSEIDKMCTLVLRELLSQMKHLGPGRRQAEIALELLVKITSLSNISHNGLINLAVNLWQLCLKQGTVDPNYMTRTKDYLSEKGNSTDNNTLQQLVRKLSM